MPKKKRGRLDDNERKIKEEEARKKSQERFERCLLCRFFEEYVNEIGEEKRKCSNPLMKGAICEEDVCPHFIRRWPIGINPVELLK